jgi:flagellar motor protein MotB
MYREIIRRLFVIAALFAFGVWPALAQNATVQEKGVQDASVKVRVSPPEAYIFVDGQPFAHRSRTIVLPAGDHTIGVYNYGYVPQITTAKLEPGRNPEIVARLQPVPGRVSGPWGKVQIEGSANDKAAVFVNGIKPEYFVGHIDEMNNGKLFHQKLVLPVGTYQLILVNPKETQPFYSEKIEVRPNERVKVNVAKNTQTYEKWHSVGKKESRARFRAGGASSAITVAPVTGNFAVDKNAIKCGEPVKLSWKSTEAAETTLNASPAQEVKANGERTDSPNKTTTYTFEAKGPGGIVTQSQTVNVDPTVQTALTASPAEVHYRRIDDKVINPGTSTLNWTAENAQSASIEPLGNVATSGNRQVAAAPKKTGVGTVDEMTIYTLMASNNCGGSDKSLAAVHVTGTIEPLPVVPLASVFFPTAYPTAKHPAVGLLNSQKEVLDQAAAGFKKFLEYDPDTRLKIIAHSDRRSSDAFNKSLSERRANVVKDELVTRGISAANIEIMAQGETQQLDKAAVKNLEKANAQQRAVNSALVLAYNRRVDLVMIPTAKPQQQSKQAFPHKMKDAKLLKSSGFVGLGTIEKASAPAGKASASGHQ